MPDYLPIGLLVLGGAAAWLSTRNLAEGEAGGQTYEIDQLGSKIEGPDDAATVEALTDLILSTGATGVEVQSPGLNILVERPADAPSTSPTASSKPSPDAEPTGNASGFPKGRYQYLGYDVRRGKYKYAWFGAMTDLPQDLIEPGTPTGAFYVQIALHTGFLAVGSFFNL